MANHGKPEQYLIYKLILNHLFISKGGLEPSLKIHKERPCPPVIVLRYHPRRHRWLISISAMISSVSCLRAGRTSTNLQRISSSTDDLLFLNQIQLSRQDEQVRWNESDWRKGVIWSVALIWLAERRTNKSGGRIWLAKTNMWIQLPLVLMQYLLTFDLVIRKM